MIAQHIETLLDQIKWYRYRDGSYDGRDPILETQSKLRRIRKGESETVLTRQDIALLTKATRQSIEHISNHQYGPGFTPEASASLRRQALAPLLDVMPILSSWKCDNDD